MNAFWKFTPPMDTRPGRRFDPAGHDDEVSGCT
jgi:hypothetical protein